MTLCKSQQRDEKFLTPIHIFQTIIISDEQSHIGYSVNMQCKRDIKPYEVLQTDTFVLLLQMSTSSPNYAQLN